MLKILIATVFALLIGYAESSMPANAANNTCEENPCSINETCLNEVCDCKYGYSRTPLGWDLRDDSDRNCEDIDECSSDMICYLEPNEMCVNTLGSYECVCYTGYERVNGKCDDINECEADEELCGDQHCKNTAGSYTCMTCPPGYAVEGEGCRDIDECSEQEIDPCQSISSMPSSTCVNTRGSYVCQCNKNYWNANGARCIPDSREPIEECEFVENPWNPYISECRCPDGMEVGIRFNCESVCDMVDDGICYKVIISDTRDDYSTAEATCKSVGKKAGFTKTKKQYELLIGLIRSKMSNTQGYLNIWTGLSRNLQTGIIKKDGAVVAPYFEWHPYNPTSFPRTQLFLKVRKNSRNRFQGMVNGTPSRKKHGIICESKLVP